MATRFGSHVDVEDRAREQLIRILNRCLANAIDLYSQAKQAHWNAKGRHFLTMHKLFDEVADNLRVQADEYAERLSALGGYAEGTVRLAANNSELSEHDLDAVTGEEHLSSVVHTFAKYASSLRNAIGMIHDLADPASEDVLIESLRAAEKDLWLLESHAHGQTAQVSPREERPPAH